MMYPYMTLPDETEITHSDIINNRSYKAFFMVVDILYFLQLFRGFHNYECNCRCDCRFRKYKSSGN